MVHGADTSRYTKLQPIACSLGLHALCMSPGPLPQMPVCVSVCAPQDVVLALLFAGADTAPKDARGFDVMIEGARGNREDIIDVLKRSGARTGISIMLQVRVAFKLDK